MSADTYIYVDKKTFEVWMCTASELMPVKGKKGLEKQKNYKIGKGRNLEKALEIADISNDYHCEYGIHFHLWCK